MLKLFISSSCYFKIRNGKDYCNVVPPGNHKIILRILSSPIFPIVHRIQRKWNSHRIQINVTQVLPNFSTHLLFIIFLSSTSHILSHSCSTRYINQNLIELSSNRVWRMLWDIYHHIFKLKSEHQVLNQYFNMSSNRQWKTCDLFRLRPCWVGQFVNTNIFLAGPALTVI